MIKMPVEVSIKRLGDPTTMMPMQVRSDIMNILAHFKAQNAQVKNMMGQLEGLQRTLIVIAKSASFEIPYAAVEALGEDDGLIVTDRKDPETGAMYKKWEYSQRSRILS